MINLVEALEMIIHGLVPILVAVAELVGVLVVGATLVRSIHHYILTNYFKKKYNYLLELGSGLSVALEFLMVAEVLKTVTVYSLEGIIEVAALFGLRALMSLLLHFEASEHAHSHKHTHKKATPAENAPAAEQDEEEDDEELTAVE